MTISTRLQTMLRTKHVTNNNLLITTYLSLGLLLGSEVLLEFSHESLLFGSGLETTVSGLGAGVDPFEGDLLVSKALGLGDERFAEGDESLLWSDDGTTDHEEVLVDNTISWETSLNKEIIIQ